MWLNPLAEITSNQPPITKGRGMQLIGYILANIVLAYSWVYDKMILSRERVDHRAFLVVVFFFVFVFTIVLFPIFGWINFNELTTYHYWLFGGAIAIAVLYNYILHKSIQNQALCEVEIFLWLNPLVTIFIASLLLPGEQNPNIMIASIVAGLAIFFAHIEKRHLKFSSYSLFMFITIILMSLETVVFRLLLEVVSPIALYGLRTGIIFLIYLFMFGIPKKGIPHKKTKELAIMAGMWLFFNFFMFTGYKNLGIVLTTLIFMTSLSITAIFGYVFLNERLKKRQILATIVIVIAIVYALRIIPLG
ncbi:MAG: DMT family transporter [bacterium]